jgi:hypothetical protein
VSGQIQSGVFARMQASGSPASLYVFLEDQIDPATSYTPGVVRVSTLTAQPNLAERWTLLGWSIRARVGVALPTPAFNPHPYGRIGRLWAGLLVDATMSNQGGLLLNVQQPGGASLPLDLSTFTVIWDPSETPMPIFDPAGAVPAEDQFGIIGQTYMLPAPIEAHSGSQMQMALILDHCLLAQSIGVILLSCEYSLIYDDGK